MKVTKPQICSPMPVYDFFALVKTNVIKEQYVKANYNNEEYFMDVLAQQAGGEFYELELDNRLDLTFGQVMPDTTLGESEVYSVVRLDEEHFIIRYLNISGSIPQAWENLLLLHGSSDWAGW